MQPFASRFTLTECVLPPALLVLLADDVPLLDDEAETELLEEWLPVDCELACAVPAASSSTMLVSTRPSAK